MSSGGQDAPVRVALVGLGWAARSIWLPRLSAHPSFVVTAAVDPDPAAREAAALEVPHATLLRDPAELGPGGVDLAVVAVPNHLHSSVACRLLERSVSVFVEKPVCLTSREAAQLERAERSGGALLLAGSAARHRADVQTLYALTATLGSLRHVDATWVRASGVPGAGRWFTARRLSGGGALLDLGWHLLDTVSPILGDTSFDQVSGTVSDDFVASGERRAVWRADGTGDGLRLAGVDVEDTARGFLVTDEGVSVHLRASWASHEALDTTTLRVEGSAGTATLRCTFGFSPNRLGQASLTVTRDGRTEAVPLPREPVGAEYRTQLDAIRDDLADPERGLAVREAKQTIGVIERVYAAAAAARVRSRRVPVRATS